MALSQKKSRRKPSGGRYHFTKTKKKAQLAGFPAQTKLSPDAKRRILRVLGGNRKVKVLAINKVTVADGKGTSTLTEIRNVVENPADPNLVRRNIITKGAVVETTLGRVRITSRPGQSGSLSGVLVS